MADEAFLMGLRGKNGNTSGGDIFDPHFRSAAQAQFTFGDKRNWLLAGIPTLLDAPAMPDAAARGDLAGSISTLVGVPMNTGVTNRKGARFGPSALRTIERVGLYAHGTWFSPMATAKTAEIGDVTMQSLHDPGRRHQNIEACYHRLVAAGVRRPVVGGDHSISSSPVKAVGAKQPTGFIHIAEYLYTAGPYEDAKFQHGGQFRLAVLDAMIDPKRAIQNGPTYIFSDIDRMGPGFAHGTWTLEGGGLPQREVLQILRCLAEMNISSGDVVEVTLRHDRSINRSHSTQVQHTILCPMVAPR